MATYWRRRTSSTLGLLLLASALAGTARAAEPPAACAQNGGSWSTAAPFESHRFGNYFISNDNFNGTPGQRIWANDAHCFGATTSATTERSGIGSYPHVVRGWTQNDADLRSQSTPGTVDWTTKSGMGIAVPALAKAKVHWAFTSSTAPGSRWMALIDVYFHRAPTPNAQDWPPVVDLMIDQALIDQPIGHTPNVWTFFAYTASVSHPFTVTLGGNRYLVYLDNAGEAGFHKPGGHNIHLFQLPTTFTDNSGVNWGVGSATTDLAAIVEFFTRANPRDDAGRPIENAAGLVVSAPLIGSDLYLTAVNAGWEVDVGTMFQTNQFWIALQNEPEGP